MMKKLLSGFLLATTAFAACNKDDDDGALNQTDRDFLMLASYGNHNEIAAGGIADSNAMNLSVDQFGNMMVSDHSTAQNELTTLASEMNITIPQMPDTTHIILGQVLRTLAGMAFDSTYMATQVADHQATIQLFQNEIANGNHELVKNYAIKYLPKIQTHYHMADSIRMEL